MTNHQLIPISFIMYAKLFVWTQCLSMKILCSDWLKFAVFFGIRDLCSFTALKIYSKCWLTWAKYRGKTGSNILLCCDVFQVKFARPETERAKAQRLSSFKYLEKKKAEELWKTVEFFNPQVLGVLFVKNLQSPSFYMYFDSTLYIPFKRVEI